MTIQAAPPAPAPERTARADLRTRAAAFAVPAALLAAFAVVQFLYLRPPSSQDGMDYFEAAARFPDVETNHRTLRIGLLLPVRLFQELFGYSEAAYYAVPLLAGAGLVLATYWVGRQWFGAAVGVGAALVLMLSDPFLMVSSLLLPDHVSVALFVAGLGVVVSVAKRRASDPVPFWTRRDHLLLAGAGLLLGWSYLVREYMPLVFPLVVLVFALDRLPWRKLVWVAAPAAGVLVAETVTNWVLHGSPFERFVAGGGHGGQRDYITDSRLDALLRLPRALAETPGGFALAAFVALTALAVLVGRRHRPFLLVFAWLALLWVPLTLGTGLVVPSFRFVIADKLRYWMPVLPAIAIGGVAMIRHGAAFAAGRLRIPDRRRRVLASVSALVVVTVLAAGAFSEAKVRDSYRVNGADQLGDLRAWLAGPGADVDVLWTDHFTARLVPIYARSIFGDRMWDGDVRAFDDGDGQFVERRELTGGAVVLYRFGYRLLPGKYAGLPTYLRRRDGEGRSLEAFRPDRSLVIVRLPADGLP